MEVYSCLFHLFHGPFLYRNFSFPWVSMNLLPVDSLLYQKLHRRSELNIRKNIRIILQFQREIILQRNTSAMLATLSRKTRKCFWEAVTVAWLDLIGQWTQSCLKEAEWNLFEWNGLFIGFTEYDRERFKRNTNIALRFYIKSTIPWTSFSRVTETELKTLILSISLRDFL